MTATTYLSKRIPILLTLLSLALVACTKSNASASPIPKMNTPVMHDTRQWCIARFVLDLPKDAQVYAHDYKYMGYSIETRSGVSRQEFIDQVDAREHELKTKMRVDPHKSFASTSHAWLQQSLQPDTNSRFFVFGRYDVPPDELVYETEGFAFSDGTLFTLKNKLGGQYDRTDALRNADEILRNIRPRGDWDVPQDGAFCFNGGAIGGKPMPGFDATLAARLVPGRPSNLVVQLRESVDVDKDASLLKDLEQLKEQLKPYAGHYTILRTGKRQFGGMQAEEMLVDIHADGVQKYEFYLLAPGVDGDPSKPHAAIQLLFGGEPDNDTPASIATSPVDKEQALQAWDTVLDSFHYRGASK